jgi:hypothetical protein
MVALCNDYFGFRNSASNKQFYVTKHNVIACRIQASVADCCAGKIASFKKYYLLLIYHNVAKCGMNPALNSVLQPVALLINENSIPIPETSLQCTGIHQCRPFECVDRDVKPP